MKWFGKRKSPPTPEGAPRGGRTARIRGHYGPKLLRRRRDYSTLDWASEQTQELRFRVLAENAELEGKSLLDVGCGLGHLYEYLQREGIGAYYTGVDILPEMVAAAREMHPDGRFLQGDVFVEDVFPPDSFDVAFCSGIFNLNLGNNREFLDAALPRLLSLVRETLAVNLLHARAAWGDDKYFHFHPGEVADMTRDLPCETKFVDDYLPNDFTVICRKRPAAEK